MIHALCITEREGRFDVGDHRASRHRAAKPHEPHARPKPSSDASERAHRALRAQLLPLQPARALGEFLVSRTADGHLGHSSPERACRSRIRSLKFFKAMLGKRVELELYDNGCVEGTFAGVESKQQMFLIRGLVTPMGTYPLAKIPKLLDQCTL